MRIRYWLPCPGFVTFKVNHSVLPTYFRSSIDSDKFGVTQVEAIDESFALYSEQPTKCLSETSYFLSCLSISTWRGRC